MNYDPVVPATRNCFNKNAVDFRDIIEEFESGTIYVHQIGDKAKFVVSGGKLRAHELNQMRLLRHDETRATVGFGLIVQIFDFKDKELVSNEFTEKDYFYDRAPVFVYK